MMTGRGGKDQGGGGNNEKKRSKEKRRKIKQKCRRKTKSVRRE
jgi:hypothetical protein